ncbi:hypothetical protein HBB16_11685 [Pseudonocardia sp. MCCB 268]|nr:hypothetical protein [Pseudonocardia cytotoxica]
MTALRPCPATTPSPPVRGAAGPGRWTQRRFAAAIGLDETKLSKPLAGRRRFGQRASWSRSPTSPARYGEPVAVLAATTRAPTPVPCRAAPAALRSTAALQGSCETRRRILEAAPGPGSPTADTAPVWTFGRRPGLRTSPATIHYHFEPVGLLTRRCGTTKSLPDRQVAELGEIADSATCGCCG